MPSPCPPFPPPLSPPPIFVSQSKCAGCKQRQYCSRACQKAHWKAGHKAECPELKARSGERAARSRASNIDLAAVMLAENPDPELVAALAGTEGSSTGYDSENMPGRQDYIDQMYVSTFVSHLKCGCNSPSSSPPPPPPPSLPSI